MHSHTELVSHITQLAAQKQPVVVAVSGFGGSGKSTLANMLRAHFHISDAQVIRIDHLYGPNPMGPDIFDQSDWPLITRILQDVRAGKRLHYTGRSFEGHAIEVDEDLPNVVIIEGVRLLHPDVMPFFDVSVWINCPQEIALQRAKARDIAQGEDPSSWDTHWGPMDKKYFDAVRPDHLASVLYGEYE